MPAVASVRGHTAEECTDEFCPRLPCRMFKEGLRRGYENGHDEGYAAGYAEGYAAGASSCSCGGG